MGNRVEPIREVEKIKKIKEMLLKSNKWRDYLLFVTGLNFGLRIGDLLRIRIKDITDSDGQIKERFEIIEEKTKKRNVIKINDNVKKALQMINKKNKLLQTPSNYLIYNLRNKSKAISRVQAYKIVRKHCHNVGLDNISIGTHTLRKSWGYHAHKSGISIEIIQAKYLHNNTNITRIYLGIEQKDVGAAYDTVKL